LLWRDLNADYHGGSAVFPVCWSSEQLALMAEHGWVPNPFAELVPARKTKIERWLAAPDDELGAELEAENSFCQPTAKWCVAPLAETTDHLAKIWPEYCRQLAQIQAEEIAAMDKLRKSRESKKGGPLPAYAIRDGPTALVGTGGNVDTDAEEPTPAPEPDRAEAAATVAEMETEAQAATDSDSEDEAGIDFTIMADSVHD
jgi:hypothetical protein